MKIVNSQQINYCNLIRQIENEIEHLPGVIYENLLYIKKLFFEISQKDQALEYCRGEFLAAKGNTSYLVVEDPTGLTIWVEDPSVELLDGQNQIDIVQTIDLEELVGKMRNIGGLSIKNRRYHLKLYEQCFLGSEAVTWMQEQLDLSREQAVCLGQRLVKEKWIHHVTDDHDFKDDGLFYRFYWDENS